MGGEFARKYPKVAGRLMLDADRCDDPHVNRLLEGFAFLAARVHRRIDDDFPEICESLTRIIHPAYLRPVPSMTIVECQADPAQGKKTAGMRVPRGTPLVTKATVEGLACRFQTAYDVELWPFTVASAEWRQPERMQRPPRATVGTQAVAAIRMRLRCHNSAPRSQGRKETDQPGARATASGWIRCRGKSAAVRTPIDGWAPAFAGVLCVAGEVFILRSRRPGAFDTGRLWRRGGDSFPILDF